MKLPITPKSQIRGALRQLWLRSRERAQALKNNNYTCTKCHVKQSTAKGKEQKVQVHHKEGVCNWEEMVEMIYQQLLCPPEKLEVLCPICHKEETYGFEHNPFH
jgi:predicted HNH restriction endonuclease